MSTLPLMLSTPTESGGVSVFQGTRAPVASSTRNTSTAGDLAFATLSTVYT